MALKKVWIGFRLSGKSKTGKTKIWQVEPEDGSFELGEIRWYGQWRRYAFFPFMNTIYESECLRRIAEFCDKESTKARKGWAKKKN